MKPRFLATLSALCLLAFPMNSTAQDDPQAEYNRFRRQAQSDYADFRRQCNAEYARFLLGAWQAYQAGPVVHQPKDDAVPPVVMPREDERKPAEPRPVPVDTVVAPIVVEPQPMPVAPIREVPQAAQQLRFTFYGIEGKVRVPKLKPVALTALSTDISGEALSKAWSALSAGDCDNLIRDCLELRLRYDLCDWAYLLMARTVAQAYCGRGNAATLMAAWVLCQTGYRVKLGTAGGRLYLLAGTRHTVFDLVGYIFDGYHYYVVVDEGQTAPTSMNICDADFPGQKPLSLSITRAQRFPLLLSSPRVIRSARYPHAAVTVQVNRHLIDFYNAYPGSMIGDNVCSRWALYANTPTEEHVVETVYPQLRDAIAGKSQLEAANILLNWIQTGMAYESDNKVWGHDRAFFAEETLFYSYCDCEDRAILYTRLVRDLLGLKCLLVFYPGHLAAAVSFTDNVSGDWISISGRKFVIADPTFIGAPVGRTMTGLSNRSAKVIVLE